LYFYLFTHGDVPALAGLLVLGGTRGMSFAGPLTAAPRRPRGHHGGAAASPSPWPGILVAAVGPSSCCTSPHPLSWQEKGPSQYPHPRSCCGSKPSIPGFLSPALVPGPGLTAPPGL